MKVIDNRKIEMVPFADLLLGEFFIYDNNLCIKMTEEFFFDFKETDVYSIPHETDKVEVIHNDRIEIIIKE